MTLDPLSMTLGSALGISLYRWHRERHARRKAERARDRYRALLLRQAEMIRTARPYHDRDQAMVHLLDLIEMQGQSAPQDQREAAWNALRCIDDGLASLAARDLDGAREVVS